MMRWSDAAWNSPRVEYRPRHGERPFGTREVWYAVLVFWLALLLPVYWAWWQ